MKAEIITSLYEHFIKTQVKRCSIKELYRLFRYYYVGNTVNTAAEFEDIGVGLWYLKRLLFADKPENIIKHIYEVEGMKFDKSVVEESFVYLMYLVANIELYYEKPNSCVHWAAKALNMVDYFHPYLNEASKKEIIEDSHCYKKCLLYTEKYNDHFSREIHDKYFTFNWEDALFKPNSVNDNVLRRIYSV